MGILYNNGVEYGGGSGGGGSNIELDKTLTVEGKAADAKAVGDAINNISNMATTVRYDSDLDAVQVKNGEEWVNWKTVGLKYFDLNTFSEDDFTITKFGSGSYTLVGLNPFYCTSSSTSEGCSIGIDLKNQLLPGYKYLNLVGSVRLYTTATATVQFINEKTGEVDYKWTSSQADQKDVGISQKIELPILEGYYTIYISFSSWYGYGTSYIKFTTFTMTNE